ncbi:glycoside hydrolase [Ceraceosorus guamensis]|uniref:Glycoside hydrolase n=1 Tax=Ceraceosorus guamensis TaxID=1522189 RepID=A0A316W889_9BASI|nr:glycoside hydrolase [Ceraceosorus guamensis]PWN44263.1 glycoside hydrolase [Ceraceosorus guamensis]
MAQGKVHGGYFTSWSIYGRGYKPNALPTQHLTHIFYAFADVKTDSGTVFLTDPWADVQIPHDSPASDSDLRGNLGALLRHKRADRTTKVILSVGGWSFSSHFAPVASDPRKRAECVRSAVELLEDHAFDGLDWDWEFPENPQQAADYVSLLREVRYALENHAQRKNEPRYLLTVAAPAGEEKLRGLRLQEMDQVLDYWNVMTYDFAGSWDERAGHQATLRGPAPSCEATVAAFGRFGVPPHKLVLGIPLYGRSFLKCGGPGSSFKGVGKGTHEAGLYDYRALPLPGAQEELHPCGAASCRTSDGEWVTYDTPFTARDKAGYVKWAGLAGAFYWDLSGDAEGQRAIVPAVAQEVSKARRRVR